MTKVIATVDLSLYAWIQYPEDDPDREVKERDIINQMIMLYYEQFDEGLEEF